MKVPDEIEKALVTAGLPYEIVRGGKHAKLFVCGHLIGTFTPSRKKSEGPKGYLPIVCRIRKLAREKCQPSL